MPINEEILTKLSDIEKLIKPQPLNVPIKINERTAPNTVQCYRRSLRSFAKFLEKQDVTIQDFTAEKITKYFEHIKYCYSEDCAKAYCVDLRAIYNYSTRFEDNAPQPFKRLNLRRRLRRRSRSLTTAQMRRIMYAPDLPPKAEFARNAFMLSFCLCGINICDLYTMQPPKNNKLHYYRQKTKDRREDAAEQYLLINTAAAQFAAPYIAADGGAKWLDWSTRTSEKNLLKYINNGLKQLAEILDLPPELSTYYARHTFATIARNDLKYDIFDVAECLNHTPPSNAIDFVYIKPDPMKASRIAAAVVAYALGVADGCAAPTVAAAV